MSKVVLVDDSRLAGVVVQRILEPVGIECVHVRSAFELLGLKGKVSVFHQFKPSVILLDIVMPDMDGLDVLRRLKARSDVTDIPVIMLTSASSERNVLESLEMGAVGFIAKPIAADKLLGEMARAARDGGDQALAKCLADFLDPERRAEENLETFRVGAANLNYLNEILDGDEDLMEEMVQVFVESCTEQIAAIAKAIKDEDGDQIRRAAHTFKGSVGNFGAPLIHDLAFEIEKSGTDEEIEVAHQHFDKMVPMVEEIHEDLSDWLDARLKQKG